MRKILAIIAVSGLFAATALAHTSLIRGDHPSSVRQQNFRLEKVAGNVHVLFGRGGNIGVSHGEDGLLTIDTQFAEVVPQLKAELRKLGSDTPKYIFNTHYHGDHTGGNPVFGRDGIIIAHQNVRDRLASTVNSRTGEAKDPAPPVALPMITYGKGLAIYFNGEQIKAVHFPKGHTDGDTILFFTGSNVVHLGDDFFVGRFPFVDLRSGGSVAGLISNIGQMIQMIPADARLIPGHGPVASIDDLKDYHAMLIETSLIVRKQMKDGKSLAQIKAAGLPEKYKNLEWEFIPTDRWIETIYQSYADEDDK